MELVNKEDALMCATGEIKDGMTAEDVFVMVAKRLKNLSPVNLYDAISRRIVLDLVELNSNDGLGTVFVSYDKAMQFKDAIKAIPPLSHPSDVENNEVNLCDSCIYDYPECPCEANDVLFGDGKGHDNICCCNKYKPITRKVE